MQLSEIYQPIEKEMKNVAEALEKFLGESENESILKISQFLLETPGKRIRPALVLLSAKAVSSYNSLNSIPQLTKIASAIELIHLASLIHDDVIDHSVIRHNKPSVNFKWGQDISIALGDYLYSKAFELISSCGNIDILYCISQATSLMCEGELAQVCTREDISLLKKHYFYIVERKTASLFAASCQVGAMITDHQKDIQNDLKEYGLNLGIAFQIVDDCMDLIGELKDLGKPPGADFKVGELTLPILNLLSLTKDKDGLMHLLKQRDKQNAFQEIKQRFVSSQAFIKTKDDINTYIQKAKMSLGKLEESVFKQNLFSLVDIVGERMAV
jgi:geranylgeranyl pyrophosphate synthase